MPRKMPRPTEWKLRITATRYMKNETIYKTTQPNTIRQNARKLGNNAVNLIRI